MSFKTSVPLITAGTKPSQVCDPECKTGNCVLTALCKTEIFFIVFSALKLITVGISETPVTHLTVLSAEVKTLAWLVRIPVVQAFDPASAMLHP